MSQGEELPDTDLPDASQWAWTLRDDQFGALARYVSPPALEGTQLKLRDAKLRDPARDMTEADSRIAGALYDRLQALDLRPGWEPWTARRTVQQIRHPRLVIDDGVGNCLELALMYSAMCLDAHVAPLLAVAPRHAFVLIQPGRFHSAPASPDDELWPPFALDGADVVGEEGVHTVFDSQPLLRKIESGELLAVNTASASSGFGFEHAQRKGLEYVQRDGPLYLIDVPWLHGFAATEPVPPPRALVEMSPYLPLAEDEFVSYPSRQQVESDLRAKASVVVLIGPSGSGKSALARRVAGHAPSGAGWFLNASQPQSLINDLAQADLARREQDTAGKDAIDREGHAVAALVRLRTAPHPWVVVLDNADGDPGPLSRFVPVANRERGQLVIVTTTNPAWAEQPGVVVIALEPLSEAEVQARLRRPDLMALSEGRPLIMNALEKVIATIASDELDAAVSRATESDLPAELLGPTVIWQSALGRPDFVEADLALAARCALLPADHQPMATHESLKAGSADRLRRFAREGLVELEDDGVMRIHRLFARVIRAHMLSQEPVYREQARVLASSKEAMQLLEERGDLETTWQLAGLLVQANESGSDATLGLPLHDIARLLEMQGDTPGSAEIYERAQPHLTDPRLVTDCLQGRARAVNQDRSPAEEAVVEAIEWVQEAQRLLEREGAANEAGRTIAMHGLLLQKLAKLDSHKSERTQLLARARELIEDAHARRLAGLPHDHPELLRSEFNFGGIELNLAQNDPASAAAHLDRAERAYVQVARRRREIYGVDIHPHIAACLSGLVLVGYYRAVLLAANEVQRSGWLREATENASLAMKQRETIDGAADGPEIRKIAARLLKVALARTLDPDFTEEGLDELFEDVRCELLTAPRRDGARA